MLLKHKLSDFYLQNLIDETCLFANYSASVVSWILLFIFCFVSLSSLIDIIWANSSKLIFPSWSKSHSFIASVKIPISIFANSWPASELFQLVLIDKAVIVNVEEFESLHDSFVVLRDVGVKRRRDKLIEVDCTVLIRVHAFH